MLWHRRPARRIFGPQAGRYAAESTSVLAARGEWNGLWTEAADGCGLARTVVVPAGVTVTAPRLGGVLDGDHGRPTRLLVEMLPGQRARDYRERSIVLALALGCGRVSVTERGGRWLALALLPADPLAEPYGLAAEEPAGFVGVDEDGRDVVLPWVSRGHTVIQGQTGGGKSTGVYGLMCPLAAQRDVLVAGVDPSGVLWRPWSDLPGAGWRASGLRDGLRDARRVLSELVDELDRRVELLPDDDDRITPSSACPLLVCVLEELPALYRAADLADRKIGAEVRGCVSRLVSEGRKLAVRLVLVAQRADAAVVDGAVRAQATVRISYAGDADALAMLHPRGVVDPDDHAVAPPGVAVLTSPSTGTIRLRVGDLPFPEYAARVRAAAAARRLDVA